MKRWRVRLTFGRLDFTTTEIAESETLAILNAQRYARACGYGGHPTTIHSWRIA
jgi:hypothetical protein